MGKFQALFLCQQPTFGTAKVPRPDGPVTCTCKSDFLVLAEGWGATTVFLAMYFYTDLGSLASARSLIYYHGTRPSTVALASH